mmetsp:Transcript_20164/g.24144  ORF Transcript_20164/g.24144 Transcript_20164/m.24144 type:complete len:357 (+) Transcript_20164:105-1175(+)|eukprot:CAMPEP_0197847966 /NCGR_PEP_ID=MMETSP1438-20131217/7638_1 /TAXON_ID=1461541 /ORGANISM="Pterosperma sp., Strain CCMP1384" /LENGTH=356 /DNA_ID=CAMNT_0043460059 /DNA_START=103 /DNA_END=1173 /DNA_ORIENTATION=+
MSAVEFSSIDIRVISCLNLKRADLLTKSDPYVEVCCGSLRGKTRVIANNPNPVFNEIFKFPIKENDTAKPIILRVYNDSKFRKHDKIGEATIHLKSLTRSPPLTSGPLTVDLYMKSKGVTGQLQVEISVPGPDDKAVASPEKAASADVPPVDTSTLGSVESFSADTTASPSPPEEATAYPAVSMKYPDVIPPAADPSSVLDVPTEAPEKAPASPAPASGSFKKAAAPASPPAPAPMPKVAMPEVSAPVMPKAASAKAVPAKAAPAKKTKAPAQPKAGGGGGAGGLLKAVAVGAIGVAGFVLKDKMPAGGGRSHTAKVGESMFGIARKHNVSVDSLLAKNPQFANGAVLPPGAKVSL